MLIATESELNIFRTLLRKHVGFDFPKGLDREFNNKLEWALNNNSLTLSALLRQLQLAVNSEAAIKLLSPLLNELLIGETYFWRDPEVFEVLTNFVLPELVKGKGNISPLLRVWSAACSTGEEAYSLSILLNRYFKDSNWLWSILGTDINQKSLEVALKAEYGEYSLRGAARQSGLLNCFEPISNGRPNRRKLRKEYLNGVRFQKLNLASQDYPRTDNNTCNYDIIFCRNIFIYFTPELTHEIINRLYDALNDGGFLIVSACEYSQQLLTRFQTIQLGAVTLYRRPSQIDIQAVTKPVKQANPTFIPPIRNQPILTLPELPAKIKVESATTHSSSRLLMLAKEAQLKGQIQEAQELAEKAIVKDSLNAECYLFLTSLYEYSGQTQEALEMARRFAYLEPQRPEGQLFLAKLQYAQGLKKRAAQSYRRLLDLTVNLNSNQSFPFLGGLSVKELRQEANESLAKLELNQPKGVV